MSDNDPQVPASIGRLPVFLRAFTPRPLSDAGTDDVEERRRVMSHLISKWLKLDDVISTLRGLLPSTSDPVDYDRIALRLAEAREEASFCKARYDAIDADQPFNTPDDAAEAALRDAMVLVDRAVANTQAIGALLDAVHALIAAYKADTTN